MCVQLSSFYTSGQCSCSKQRPWCSILRRYSEETEEPAYVSVWFFKEKVNLINFIRHWPSVKGMVQSATDEKTT